MKSVEYYNDKILELMSRYLNLAPTLIKPEMITDITKSCDVSDEYAYAVLLAAACGLNTEENTEDNWFFHQYLLPMIKEQSVAEYEQNSYYQNIRIRQEQIGNWILKTEQYAPYEGFVYNDMIQYPDGRVLPQIGFFDRTFTYLAMMHNGRIWMTITPNEINTMKEPVSHAKGNVLTFGMGLGYYAYMAAQKEEVNSVTIVETDDNVIRLFTKYILPMFSHPEKIQIVKADAYAYANKELQKHHYDEVFTDIWHDVSDGKPAYLKMRQYEKNSAGTQFDYWIEKTIRCYL